MFSSRQLPLPFAFHLLRPTEEAVSPLHVAINKRSNSDVGELLKTDQDFVKVKDDGRRTPLEFAIDLLEPSLVESILKYTQVSDCPQALHRCVSVVCHEDIPQPKRRNDSTVTESLWPRIIKKNKLVILQMLLKAGWDPNKSNVGHDYTPLVQSAHLNQHECLEILLKNCDVDYMQVLLHTALHGGGEKVLSMIVHYIKENIRDPQITSILESGGCNEKPLYHCAIGVCFHADKAEVLIPIIYEFLGSYMSCDMIVQTTLKYSIPIRRNVVGRFLDPVLAQLIEKYWKTPENGGSTYIYLSKDYDYSDDCSPYEDKGKGMTCKVHTACCFTYVSLMAKLWKTAEVLFDKGAGNILLFCMTTKSNIHCKKMAGYNRDGSETEDNTHLLGSFTSNSSYRIPCTLVERLLEAAANLKRPIDFKYIYMNYKSIYLKHNRPPHISILLIFGNQHMLTSADYRYLTKIPANILTTCINMFPMESLKVLNAINKERIAVDPKSITAPHKASSNTKMSKRCDFIQGGVVGAKLLSLEQAKLIRNAVKLIGRANACGVHYIPYAYCFCPQYFLQHIHPHVVMSTPEFMVSCRLGHNGHIINFSPIELLALKVKTEILVQMITDKNSHNLGILMALCCGFKYLSECQRNFIY